MIFTGDIIYSLKEHFAMNPLESFKEFLLYINRFETPYIITFGNHDSEPGSAVQRAQLRALYDEICLYRPDYLEEHMVGERYSYIVPIYDALCQSIENLCIVLDSGDYAQMDTSYYAWILPEQIKWYKEMSAKYEFKDVSRRHLVFQHIPIPEYWLATLEIKDGEFAEEIEANVVESHTQKNLSIFQNFVASPEINSGFFFELTQTNAIWGMFVGHDHDNNFDGVYKGIHLVYGQSSGFNTYGKLGKAVRMITISKDDIDTSRHLYDELKTE